MSKFSSWGFKKNIKAWVMTLIAVRREQRKTHGKDTRFVYNRREVDESKIERFIRDHCRGVDLSAMVLDHCKLPLGFPIQLSNTNEKSK